MNLRMVATGAEIFKAGISGVNFLVLALVLGPTSYGNYVLIVSVAAILFPVVTLGYASWVQPLAAHNGVGMAASAVVLLLLLFTVPLFLLGLLFAHICSIPIPNVVVFVSISEMIIFPTWTSMIFSLLAVGKKWAYLSLSALIPLFKLGCTVYVGLTWGNNLYAWAIVATIAGSVGFGLTLIFLRGFGISQGMKALKQWGRRGFGFSTVAVASALTDNVDRLVVGNFLGVNAVGVYGMAGRLSTYGGLPVKAIATVAYPSFFTLADSRDASGIRVLMKSTVQRGFIIGLLMSGFVLLVGYIGELTILRSYRGLFVCVAFMAFCIPLKAIQYAAGDVLYALNNSRMRLVVTLAGAALSAAGAFFGSHYFGLPGAAFGLFLAQGFVALILALYANRIISADTSYSVTLNSDSITN